MTHRHSLVREGILCGLIGASAVAVVFFVLDLARGEPLHTPRLLGTVITGEADPRLAVIKYTAVHVLSFVVFGMALTELVHLAVRSPVFRFAVVMLLVAFEFFFAGVVLLLFEGSLQSFSLPAVLAANAIAVIGMMGYLWRRHPALKRSLQREALGG